MVALACILIVLVVVVVVVNMRSKMHHGGKGRMKLTPNHADTLPSPYPEERTFENPIYQVRYILTQVVIQIRRDESKIFFLEGGAPFMIKTNR